MKLKYIAFEFENCDGLTIEGKHIDDLRIDDIKTSFASYASGTVCKTEKAGVFAAEINKAADVIRYQFDDTGIEDLKQYTFQRLKCRDIVCIAFETEDDNTKYSYDVKWSDDDFINGFQKSYISDNGNMYIVIDEHKGIEDYFNMELINSPGYCAEDYAK
ncbi:MAG: hypothetical protein IJZ72_03365 [Oscillospiraceae bacterium]|nr:hypothetical protein [Oscillospiraceae bacterium]